MKPMLRVAVGWILVAGIESTPVLAQAHPHDMGSAASSEGSVPLLGNLGPYHRKISTSSVPAQRYFDQGLNLLFAFDMQLAQRSFEEAARRDPECGMCHWGAAMSLGPHINIPAMPDRTVTGRHAAQRAIERMANATPVEKALIEAVAKRYSDPAPTDAAGQYALDEAYANAMRQAMKQFPDDHDVAALFAESMMNLRPWDYWTRDGSPNPGTEEMAATLEDVLRRSPHHPGANHYYIHLMELPFPEKAVRAAESLRRLNSGAGHMTHMPAHIFQRVGRLDEAYDANARAVKMDDRYFEKVRPDGFILMYAAHNFHFLSYTATMQGRSAEALVHARSTIDRLPVEALHAMAGMDFFHATPMTVNLRFGRWDDVLREPVPLAGFPFLKSMWHYARATAFAAKGSAARASAERDSFTRVASRVPADAMESINLAHAVLRVATHSLAGNLARAKGQTETAIEHYRAGVAAEDSLKYDEPPGWWLHLRPTLGAALLKAGKTIEAEQVYRDDLVRNPANGWSLLGLKQALEAQKRYDEAARIEPEFKRAWSRADVRLTASSF